MKELNPSENPWTTLNKHFGEDAEKENSKVSRKEKRTSAGKTKRAKTGEPIYSDNQEPGGETRRTGTKKRKKNVEKNIYYIN